MIIHNCKSFTTVISRRARAVPMQIDRVDLDAVGHFRTRWRSSMDPSEPPEMHRVLLGAGQGNPAVDDVVVVDNQAQVNIRLRAVLITEINLRKTWMMRKNVCAVEEMDEQGRGNRGR